jgi:hypothetical protein
MAKVKFTGTGSFVMALPTGKELEFTTGTILDLPDDVAAEMLARREGGQPVWQDATAISSPGAAPAAQTPKPAASAPAPGTN